MTKKEKRTGTHSEPAKGSAGKDTRDNNSAADYAARIHPKEVFDSSKYNAMSDMSKGANLETLADTRRTRNNVKAEKIDNKSITTTGAASSSAVEEAMPKINPMMVEERARTIGEVNEEEMHHKLSSSTSSSSLSYQSGKEKKFILYLNIMLSIENAAIERLPARIQQSQLVEVREQLVHHLEETREQKSRLITLIHRLGGQPTNERADLSGISLPKVLADAAFKASATNHKNRN